MAGEEATPSASTSKTNPLSTPAYALHQHLPTGDYFTSAARVTRADLQSLPKGQASFLEIHPTPALPTQAFPTLGTYATSSAPPPTSTSTLPKRTPLTQQRTSTAPKPSHASTLSSAAFIDYGIFSSLAPAFDSDGGQVGRDTLGLVSTFKRERSKKKSEARAEVQKALRELATKKLGTAPKAASRGILDEATAGLGRLDVNLPPTHSESRDALASLAASLLENDEEAFSGVLRALDLCSLEDELNALLAKNSRALRRIQTLQAVRFRAGTKGKEVGLVEGSEEWTMGRELLASLAAIVTLRPRAEGPAPSRVLAPRHSVLHSLQRSAPRDPTPGYRGTLCSTRDFALIDNTTIRPSPSAALLPPPPITNPAATATPAAGSTLPPAPSLANAPGQYGYATRTSTTSYGYAGRGAAASGSGSTTPRALAANPNAQYYPPSAYQYSQQPSAMNGGYYTPSNIANSYTSTRAVPNLGGKPINGAHGQWGTTGGTGGIPGGMALPPHLRGARPASSPYASTLYSSTPSGTSIGAGMSGVAKPNGTSSSWTSVMPTR